MRRSSRSRTFDRVLFDGKEFGQLAVPGTPDEEEFLGLPGLLEPTQITAPAAASGSAAR